MNGEICCILGVCCPPGSTSQRDALAHELSADLGLDRSTQRVTATPHDIAAWMLTHFDLAPAGTLAPFRDAILKHADKRKK